MSISRDIIIKIKNNNAKLDKPLVVYERDHGLMLNFKLQNHNYKYGGNNILDSVDDDVLFAYSTLVNPQGYELSNQNGTVLDDVVQFVITEDMTDELTEIGIYQMQIHIVCEHSEFSIPPIEFEVRERLKGDSEGNSDAVGRAAVDISYLQTDEGSFMSEDGTLNIVWRAGDIISSTKLNEMVTYINENAVKGPEGPKGEQGPEGPEGPKGDDGYTPIKGVDYFTTADKEEMLSGYATEKFVSNSIANAQLGDVDTSIFVTQDDLYIDIPDDSYDTNSTMLANEPITVAEYNHLLYTNRLIYTSYNEERPVKGQQGCLIGVMPPVFDKAVTIYSVELVQYSSMDPNAAQFIIYDVAKKFPENENNYVYVFTKKKVVGEGNYVKADKLTTISFSEGVVVQPGEMLCAVTPVKALGYCAVDPDVNFMAYVYGYNTNTITPDTETFELALATNNAWQGAYTVTYEEGAIEGSETPQVTYTITNNLSNATNNNTNTSINENSKYAGFITANSGYEIDKVTVVMGENDITSSVYANGYINIPSVTANIIITVSTTVKEISTNRRKITEVVPEMILDIRSLKNNINSGNEFGVRNARRGDTINKYFVMTVDDIGRQFFDVADTLSSIGFYPALALKMESMNGVGPTGITWDELRQLQDIGFEICFHGMLHSHTPAGTAPNNDDIMIADIAQFKSLCQQNGIKICGYCAPNHYPLPVDAFKEFEWARSAYGLTSYGWNINYSNNSRMNDSFASIDAGTSMDWGSAPTEETIQNMINLADHENLKDNFYLTPMCHTQNLVANIDSYMQVFNGWIAKGLTPMRCCDAVRQSLWDIGYIGNNSTFEIQAGTASNPYWIVGKNGVVRSNP